VYRVSWKLNDEPIQLADIPRSAFDTEGEKQRVGEVLEEYNTTLNFTEKEDAVFAGVTRERTARHPWRTYAGIPLARAAAIWLTPRIESLPFSGRMFPLAERLAEDPADFCVTAALFLINLGYLLGAGWGAARLWRSGAGARPALALLCGYVALRTAFLTTLETPEPRYVLVCFPILIALAAQAFRSKN